MATQLFFMPAVPDSKVYRYRVHTHFDCFIIQLIYTTRSRHADLALSNCLINRTAQRVEMLGNETNTKKSTPNVIKAMYRRSKPI